MLLMWTLFHGHKAIWPERILLCLLKSYKYFIKDRLLSRVHSKKLYLGCFSFQTVFNLLYIQIYIQMCVSTKWQPCHVLICLYNGDQRRLIWILIDYIHPISHVRSWTGVEMKIKRLYPSLNSETTSECTSEVKGIVRGKGLQNFGWKSIKYFLKGQRSNVKWTSSQAPSYASPKLLPSDPGTHRGEV